jgi:hypothetical protein
MQIIFPRRFTACNFLYGDHLRAGSAKLTPLCVLSTHFSLSLIKAESKSNYALAHYTAASFAL